MESSSVNGMCRCCASEGAFKDIKTSYHWMGDEEVYADMLRECFDVNLSSGDQGGICEVCITQLRNAANFKKQVLHTEEQFKQHLRSKGFKAAQVKEEMSGFDDNDSDDMDNCDDEDYVPEYEIPIKTESESEEKPKKRSAKAVSTRSKKSKSSDDAAAKSFLNVGNVNVKTEEETEWGLTIKKIDRDPTNPLETRTELARATKLNFRLVGQPTKQRLVGDLKTTKKKKVAYCKKLPTKNVNIKIDNLEQVINEINTTAKKVRTVSVPKRKVALNVKLNSTTEARYEDVVKMIELDKQRFNIRLILQCSNATPIRAHYAGNGYACCFCDKFFPTAAKLKSHTIEDHDKKEKNKFMQKAVLSSFLVKLDITALSCICKMEFEQLEDLITHLKESHDKKYYSDITKFTVCFKFEKDEFKCIMCQYLFNSFKKLLEHMNNHFRNYVCKICDTGFVNQRMLIMHKPAHVTGEFECSICKKVFDKLRSLKHHEKGAHVVLSRHKCFQCGEKFATLNLKKEHMTEFHGVQYALIPCLACEKTFKDKNGLRIHTKRDHLMERRFDCKYCDKKFFTLALMRDHTVIHTGTRDFKCDACGKDFARKKTLQYHMRTHKEDGKLSCVVCRKEFFKQANLDSHMQCHSEVLNCNRCALVFESMASLQSHVMTMHGVAM